KAEGLVKEYIDGERKLTVLSGVSLHVNSGEFVSIVGQSGSGKSTLLHLLGALDRPTQGSVHLDGQDYSKLSERSLARLRSDRVGFIFQFHHLLPEFTALENVLIPGMIRRETRGAITDRAEEMLRQVGLGERMTHRPTKLSGGEQQRVALARALMNNPTVVLADEPTGNLDAKTAEETIEFMVNITSGAGRTLVLVTHDPIIAARADRVLRLEVGRLVED
ncbi:MAG: ABC transporter ATP-binding protein, partial [Candidatus Sumerlaeia bacterium]|nr:ABC transporter ATP-binding protein [Candidatus Sumerlaeia bacterium]